MPKKVSNHQVAGHKAYSMKSHEEIKHITTPAFVLSLLAGALTLFFAVWETKGVLLNNDVVFQYFVAVLLVMHYTVAVLMFASAILLKREHHVLAASIMLLCASTAGLVLLAGFFIGPAMGILGGIAGVREYEKMIKHV
jgi:ABC-type multidrug transport system permease subunit